ncbi:MAG: hypothetical protein ACREDP_25460, partial [Bradyrhizobium sp.]
RHEGGDDRLADATCAARHQGVANYVCFHDVSPDFSRTCAKLPCGSTSMAVLTAMPGAVVADPKA